MFDFILGRTKKESIAMRLPILYGILNSIRKRSSRLTFSQCGEDLTVLKYLPERDGMYVDIGGGHPVIGSNSFLLDKRGYTGTIVEPINKFSEKFKKRRNVVKVFETVCAPGNKAVDFYEFENSFLSTSSKEVADALLTSGEKLVSKKRLVSKLLSELGVAAMPSMPSLLDVDVEGLDLDVLKSNDWSTFRPRVILVESQLQNRQVIQDYLGKLNYALTEVCEITLVFVSKEYLQS
jgi:hypothetical protein